MNKMNRDIEYIIDGILISTKIKLRKGSKGWYKENGYIMRKVNYHPKASPRGYVAEHRLVMEQHLGRFLDSKEVVHHCDENRENNNLSNLKLEILNSEHIKNEHKKMRNTNGQFVCQEPIFNEIIFRLYNKDKKTTLEYTLNKLISTTFRRSKFEFRGRYTGLKDKNGKKIFEGDIVKSKYGVFKSKVEWNDSFCGFFPFCNNDTGIFADECEVIGNIYEHKELLK